MDVHTMLSAYVSSFIPFTAADHPLKKYASGRNDPQWRLGSNRRAYMSASDSSEDAETIPSAAWREVRAQLHAGSAAAFEDQKKGAYRAGYWAHPISVPEIGCFLASHPAFFRRDAPYLTQSVVFIVAYSPSKGATGLVLNRPLHGMATQKFPREVRELLGSQYVYLGGPDTFEGSPLLVLHSDEKAVSSRQVLEPLPGVYVDSLATSRGRLAITASTRNLDMRVFAGCLSWAPGKLEAEVDTGEWFCISASEKFATSHCIQLPKPLWVEIMESQGEPFARIARRLYGNEE